MEYILSEISFDELNKGDYLCMDYKIQKDFDLSIIEKHKNVVLDIFKEIL